MEKFKQDVVEMFEPEEAKEEGFYIKNTMEADWAFKKIRAKKEEFEEKKNYILSCMARYARISPRWENNDNKILFP